MRLSGGTKTISLDWGQNGGYGSLKVTGDGTYGYLAFIADNPTFANQINVGDTIVITQGGNPYASANVISTYDTFSDAVVADPTLDWNGIRGIKLDNAFGLTGFQSDVNIDGFVVTQRKGLRITGSFAIGAYNIRGLPTSPGIDLAGLSGMPRALWPTVSVSGIGGNFSSWTGRATSPYATPTGYTFVPLTFVDDWGGGITVNGMNVTYNDTTSPYSNAVFGPSTNVGSKSMYSFTMNTYNGAPYDDAIGVTSYVGTDLNTYLGNFSDSIGVFDTGGVIWQDNQITAPNGPTFEADGVVVDILIDNDSTSPKMWYSVNGTAWIGDFGYVVPPSVSVGGIYWQPVPIGRQNQIDVSYTNWDGSTIYWTITGGTSTAGDFDVMSGTLTSLTGSGTTSIYFTPNPQAAEHSYHIFFGSTAGDSNLLDAGPYNVKNYFTIDSASAPYMSVNGSGVISYPDYTTDGTWGSRMQITGDTTLESTWNTFNGQTTGLYTAIWNNGKTGFVYLESPGATGGYIDLAVAADGAGSPGPADTYQFPVILSPS